MSASPSPGVGASTSMTLRLSAGPSDGQISAFMGRLPIYLFFSNQSQDCSPHAGRQGARPEFRPDRTAGKSPGRWPTRPQSPVQKDLLLMTRLVVSSLAIGFAAAAVSAALCPPAAAATKAKHAAKPAAKAAPKPAAKDAASKPSLVATFGDWNVFVGEVGKGRICYTL